MIRGHVIRLIKRFDLVTDISHPSRAFFMEKFPQYWAEAQALNEHHLL